MLARHVCSGPSLTSADLQPHPLHRLWRLMRIVHTSEELFELEHADRMAELKARIKHLQAQLEASEATVRRLQAVVDSQHT